MKFETVKNKKKVLLIGIMCLLVGATIILVTSLAAYRTTQTVKLAEGNVKYIIPDVNIVAMYRENGTDSAGNKTYASIETIPKEGYYLGANSACYINSDEKLEEITINYDGTKVSIDGLTTKGTKCYLYFDAFINADEYILANKTIQQRTDFSSVFTEETTGKLFEAQDDLGTTYYYAGKPTDNHLKFAGHYWRIVRINGNGSIRLIYNGDASVIDESENKEYILKNGYYSNGVYSNIEISGSTGFSTNINDNMYVGFMYESGVVHGLATKSEILTEALEPWYEDNLITYVKYIDEVSGFCGDRTAYTDQSGTTEGGGTGSTQTYYGAWTRLTNSTPTFKCPYKDGNGKQQDLYTVDNESGIGNEALTYPIGLITIDEAAYAGGIATMDRTVNEDYYLYNYSTYYTISPAYLNRDGDSFMFRIGLNGFKYDATPSNTSSGVRPVINLSNKLPIFGSGTTDNPYVVKLNER